VLLDADIERLEQLLGCSVHIVYSSSLMINSKFSAKRCPLDEITLTPQTKTFVLFMCAHDEIHTTMKRAQPLLDNPRVSVAFVVPLRQGVPMQFFRGWTSLIQWDKRRLLFDSSARKIRRCPWRVRVFLRPASVAAVCPIVPLSGTNLLFTGLVNESKARILADSGATQSMLDAQWATQLGIIPVGSPEVVTLGDNRRIHTLGMATVDLNVNGFHTQVKTTPYSIIGWCGLHPWVGLATST
jgi:metal-dependent hydrolase (beta-lactamase superfamily II)